jgi:hypothetical protein
VERTSFRVPLKISDPRELGGPCAFEIDLIALLREIGETGVPDAFALRAVDPSDPPGAAARGTAVQFSPAFQERLPLDAPGTPPPTWICRFPAGLGAPVPDVVAVRGQAILHLPPGPARPLALEFDRYDAAWAVQVPYPPNHFRLLLPDGRVPPVPFAPVAQAAPLANGRLEVRIGRDPFFTYVHDPSVRPYFFPFRGPSGDVLTRLGHPHDPTESHRHHRSLWIAHASVGGVDFWHDWRPEAGGIRHLRFPEREQGPVFTRFAEDLEWRSPDEELMLAERRTFTVYGDPSGDRLLDLEIELSAARDLTLGASPFGFLAFRVAELMTPYDGGGVIRNAEGLLNDALCLKPSRWADASGPVSEGADAPRWAGLAILDHPANPVHPTPFYCRNDGWLGAAATGVEERSLREGDHLRLRYRLVAHDGSAGDGSRIEAAWQAFARPPVVRIAGPAARVGRSGVQWE